MVQLDSASLRSRVERATSKHGTRGLPFAVARRALTGLEDWLNPHHVNHLATGYTDVVTAPSDVIGEVYAAEFQTLVTEIPLADLRWSRLGLRLTADHNPFVRTVVDHLSGRQTDYEGSELQQHYDSWQPCSVAETLGLLESQSPAGSQTPTATVLPWMAEAGLLAPDLRLERVERWNREETRSGDHEMGHADGHKHFGPVSDAFGRFEYDRYTQLADTIVAAGFRPRDDDGYVGTQLLVTDDRMVGVITGPGLHRTIVAAALGVDPLVVAVSRQPPLVHRSDVARWPGVRSGLFVADEALEIFDRLVAGDPPPGFPAVK